MAELAALSSGQPPCPQQLQPSSNLRQPLHNQISAQDLTIFCDFDGPIVDVSERYHSTYLLGLAEVSIAYQAEGVDLPIAPLSKEQFWQMKQERMPDPEIALRSGLQGEQIALFLKRVSQIVNQTDLLHQDQLQPGVKWALSLLHAQGARLVLVTLRCQAQATQMLRTYGLEHLFSRIQGANNLDAAYANHAQHKTQLLSDVVAEYSTETASAWMIGDTEADILAGQAMGVPTIALTCGIRSRNYLQKFAPTRIHADLLSAAHYLVSARLSWR
jgi:phosphoglycolate phosphatase